MSFARLCLVALLFVLGGAMPVSASLASPATMTDEHDLLELINDARAATGLSPLMMLGDLVDDARIHTHEMIETGELYHSATAQISSYATDWSLLGENVGLGPNMLALHRAFMASPSHAENVLGDFTDVGIGTARAPDGTMFVTVVFLQRAAEKDDPDFELSPISAEGLRSFGSGFDTRVIPDRIVSGGGSTHIVTRRCGAVAGCPD